MSHFGERFQISKDGFNTGTYSIGTVAGIWNVSSLRSKSRPLFRFVLFRLFQHRAVGSLIPVPYRLKIPAKAQDKRILILGFFRRFIYAHPAGRAFLLFGRRIHRHIGQRKVVFQYSHFGAQGAGCDPVRIVCCRNSGCLLYTS